MAIPSPSPSPSPHSFTRLQYSPNIFITSPTSPTPFASSHSRSPSRESQTHANAHTTLPILSIPNAMTTGPFHTPSSPTASDIVPGFYSQRPGHGRSQSHLGARTQRHPNITLTLDTDDGRRSEKRARTEGDMGNNGSEGLRAGEEMDIVPSDAGEDVKLASPTTNTGVGNRVVGLRSRSDSAPMWGGEQNGLSANWTRGRSGSSFGQ
ncbi:hypothetical protein OG21DRAFT_1507455 [Imleria badia]|nr:hypothetical protein OG21DRAFT_1507455 [Imleria badia]